MTRIGLRIAVVVSLAAVLWLVGGKQRQPRLRASAVRAGLPILFETNLGQTEERVRFLARARGHTLFVTDRADAVVSYKGGSVTMSLVGANETPEIEGRDTKRGKANYFIGRDRSKWRTNIPLHDRVVCRAVYPGIDLVYYSRGGQLEFDFIVAPGADPAVIEMEFSEDVELNARGDLVVGAVRHSHPFIHQDGDRVAGRFVLRGERRAGFEIDDYDRARPLVIDPVVEFSTFYGGSAEDAVRQSIMLAPDGCFVAVGESESLDLPGVNALFPYAGGTGADAAVFKLSPDGQEVLFFTFIGGSDEDSATALDIDDQGRIYVSGFTESDDYPTTTGVLVENDPATITGHNEAFVTIIEADGSALVASSYLGGTGNDAGWEVRVGPSGDVYLAGWTKSEDFPITPNAYQPEFSGRFMGYLTRLSPDLTALVYSTYLGGVTDDPDKFDALRGIAIDQNENVYVCGEMSSTDVPLVNGFQMTHGGGERDGVIAKFRPDGTVAWATYLGGSGGEFLAQIVYAEGSVWVCGNSDSANFPVMDELYAHAGGRDGLLARLHADTGQLEFSTLVGGSSEEFVTDLVVSPTGIVYAAGSSNSDDLPVVRAVQPEYSGPADPSFLDQDAFVLRFDSNAARIDYLTYWGAPGWDLFPGITVDAAGTATIAGFTQSPDFPTVNAIQPTYGGGDADAFFAQFSLSDSDEDGLPDLWEEYGYTAADGTFVNLPGMGANPLRKDIFVEIDYTTGQKPTQAALDLVVAAFAAAPIGNPDGSFGISLHCNMDDEIDCGVDDEIAFTGVLGSESTPGIYDWDGDDPMVTYFQDLKDLHFTESLAPVARYCVFASKIDFGDGSFSGISRADAGTGFAGSDFVVSLGTVGVGGVGSVVQQAGTFIHELGHNLGLRHGGGDSTKKKPNYLSVMNPFFQLNGLVCSGGVPCIDFSRQELPDLDENALDEAAGIGGAAAGLGTKMQAGSSTAVRSIADASGAIDWNESGGDSETDTYALDLNGDNLPIPGAVPGSLLTGFNDWANLVFKGGSIGALGSNEQPLPPPPATTEPPEEVDEETAASLGLAPPTGLKGHSTDPQTTLTWKPVEGATYNVYRKADGDLEFLGNRTQSNYHDKTAETGVEYLYSVASVDEFGIEGPSVSVTVVAR